MLSAYFRAPTASLAAATADEIAETAFAALRSTQKISAALRRPHAQPEKATLLAALVLGRSINLTKIEPLLDEERTEFLSKLKARKADLRQPQHRRRVAVMAARHARLKHLSEADILAFGRSVNQSAPLDVRVNTSRSAR